MPGYCVLSPAHESEIRVDLVYLLIVKKMPYRGIFVVVVVVVVLKHL